MEVWLRSVAEGSRQILESTGPPFWARGSGGPQLGGVDCMQFLVFLCPSVCVWVSFGVLCLCVGFASPVSVDGRSSMGVSLHGRLCMFLFGARVPACSSSWLFRSAS